MAFRAAAKAVLVKYLSFRNFTLEHKKGQAMNTHLDNDEQRNKLDLYTRRSQKDRDNKRKEPNEIKEAKLFEYAQKLGWQESNIILF